MEISHCVTFRWDIHNPFLPFHTMEATFCSDLPDLVHWKVTLWPETRSLYKKFFHVYVEGYKCDETVEFPAELVLVNVYLNENVVTRREKKNHVFCDESKPCRVKTDIDTSPTEELIHLTILVQIHLKGQPKTPPLVPSSSPGDLLQLSNDLERLLTVSYYSDMVLLSNEGSELYNVHSYIMKARWKNLFEGQLPANREVETTISDRLLKDILTYMYSGKLRMNWPDWRDAPYIAELFQVIDRYKLYHLYKVFVKTRRRQTRKTTKHLLMRSYLFHFRSNVLSGGWKVEPETEYECIFYIQICKDGEKRWLEYSLESRSPRTMYAQVNLACVKDGQPDVWMHERIHKIFPDQIRYCEEVRPVGNVPIFENFNTDEDVLSIRCILRLSDDTAVVEVKNMVDGRVQNEDERLNALSDCMSRLLSGIWSGREESDFKITCPAEDPYERHAFVLHKDIFVIRVPKYWRVLQNVLEQGGLPVTILPDEVQTNVLRSQALSFVLVYIYTGKLSAYPVPDGVSNFAQRSEFVALQELVRRMCVDYSRNQ